MTPAARVAAAIGLLDQILGGAPAERCLTNWARANRYAGSGDRAAIRDHVFDALRRRSSYAALGGALTGRGLMIGAMRHANEALADIFSGAKYAPDILTPEEAEVPPYPEGDDALDVPPAFATQLREDLADAFAPTLDRLRDRAPLFLRVNLRKATPEHIQTALADDGISTRLGPLSPTALEVTDGTRRLQHSEPYRAGLVEIQDAASQAVVDHIPPAKTVLDLCAGGGGKTLALAARFDAEFFAHDIAAERMADLPPRAERAGIKVTCLRPCCAAERAPYDLVVADVPCSGSGAWRRQPAAKWTLTPSRLADFIRTQAALLDEAADLTSPDGTLAYITCSLFSNENSKQIESFLQRRVGWCRTSERFWSPLDGGDGLFLATLRRVP